MTKKAKKSQKIKKEGKMVAKLKKKVVSENLKIKMEFGVCVEK